MTATILVVDDEPDLEALVLQKFRKQIRDGAVAFVFAHDGIEALQSIEQNPHVDMVVSDINMPRMDGLSLLQKLQEAEDKKSTIIVSAYGDMSNIRTAMNRGAFDFLTKPIDFGDLELTIDKTIRHVEMMREARRRQAEAERAHASLSRYFSPQIASRLAAIGDSDGMEVHWREVAAIFTDITGFTSLVETAAPEVLGALLNEYVGGMTDVVFAHEGTVAKIIGDAIQVLFNAPGDQPDYATPRGRLRARSRYLGADVSRALEGEGREFRRHPDRRSRRSRAGRQFRRQPVFRLHRLWRHHQHRGAARGCQQVSRHPHLRQRRRGRRPPEISGGGRSAISCCAAAASRFAPSSRCRTALFTAPATAQYSEAFAKLEAGDTAAMPAFAALGWPACRRCAGRISP